MVFVVISIYLLTREVGLSFLGGFHLWCFVHLHYLLNWQSISYRVCCLFLNNLQVMFVLGYQLFVYMSIKIQLFVYIYVKNYFLSVICVDFVSKITQKGRQIKILRMFLRKHPRLGTVPAHLIPSELMHTFVNQMHHSYLGQCAQLE